MLSIFREKSEVQKVLDHGGMGTLYLARDPAIDRIVAVKLIQTAIQLLAKDLRRYRERFCREAKAAGCFFSRLQD